MKAAVLLVLLTALPAAAQTPERLPLFTVDAHAATVGLPQAEGWVPVVSDDTMLPGRNWGLSTGATIYPFRLGLITFGAGASGDHRQGQRRVADHHVGFRCDRHHSHHSSRAHGHHESRATGIDQLRTQAGMELFERRHRRLKSHERADAAGSTPAVEVPEAWNRRSTSAAARGGS
jgi:hypothetical protein